MTSSAEEKIASKSGDGLTAFALAKRLRLKGDSAGTIMSTLRPEVG